MMMMMMASSSSSSSSLSDFCKTNNKRMNLKIKFSILIGIGRVCVGNSERNSSCTSSNLRCLSIAECGLLFLNQNFCHSTRKVVHRWLDSSSRRCCRKRTRFFFFSFFLFAFYGRRPLSPSTAAVIVDLIICECVTE